MILEWKSIEVDSGGGREARVAAIDSATSHTAEIRLFRWLFRVEHLAWTLGYASFCFAVFAVAFRVVPAFLAQVSPQRFEFEPPLWIVFLICLLGGGVGAFQRNLDTLLHRRTCQDRGCAPDRRFEHVWARDWAGYATEMRGPER